MLSRILTFSFLVAPVFATGFQEYEVEQDLFNWSRSTSTSVRLHCYFSPHPRVNVAPLVFAIPEDVSIEWKLLQADATVSRESLRLTEEDVGEIRQWIRESRQWLADIPMAVFRFGPMDRFPLADTVPGKTLLALVREATFELTFTEPFPETPETEISPTGTRDVYLELGKYLAVNPQDVPGARGKTFPPPADRIPKEADLEYLGVRPEGSGYPCLRIVTRGEAVVSISGQEVSEAGFNLALHPVNLLTLYHLGRPVPISTGAISGDRWRKEESVWFLARPVESHETWENVYFLTWSDSPGDRIVDLGPDYEESLYSSAPAPREWGYREISLEENDPTLQVHGSPGVFDVGWKRFETPDDSFEVYFDLPGLIENSDSSAKVGVECRFLAASGKKPLATLTLEIDGRSATSISLSGTNEVVTLPCEIFGARGNRMTLRSQGNGGETLLDRLTLSYPSDSPLASSFLSSSDFYSAATTREAPWGVVRRKVPQAGGDWRTLLLKEGAAPSYFRNKIDPETSSLLTYTSDSKLEWRLFDLKKAAKPSSLGLVGPRIIHSEENQADLLAIAPELFHEPLSSYLARRSEQGWSWRLLSPQNVYDEFSFGIKDHSAIRAYCRWALQHYPDPKPQFLWLVGEASWDPKRLLGPGSEDLIPCPPFETVGGLSGDDQEYVKVIGGDQLPDLLVARLSIATVEELENYLEKALASEASPELGWWRATSLLLSDHGFRGHHHAHLDWGLINRTIPEFFSIEDYPLNRTRVFEALGREGDEARGIREDVATAWSRGASFLEYVGHGGVTVWSTKSLFKGLDRPDSDVRRLTNKNRYPFMLVRSCLSGGVNWPTPPGTVSVAEETLRAPDRGAVAAIGAAGTTYQDTQERYARKVHAALWNRGIRRLGLVRGYAHSKFVLQRPDEEKMAGQFHLHGDPLLQLSFPNQAEITAASWSLENTVPLLSVSWKGALPSGKGQMRLHLDGEILFESEPFSCDGVEGSQSWSVSLPSAVKTKLSVGLYFWDETTDTDAFAGLRIPPYPLPETEEIPLKSNSKNPRMNIRLIATHSPLVKGSNEPFLISVSPPGGGEEHAPVNVSLSVDDVLRFARTLRVQTGAASHERIAIPFAKSGRPNLRIDLDTIGLGDTEWSNRLSGHMVVSDPGRLQIGEISIDPEDAVTGETLFVNLPLSNVGPSPVEVVEARCDVLPSTGSRFTVYPIEKDRTLFPMRVMPSEIVDITWAVSYDLPEGVHQLEVTLKTEEGSTIRTVSFQVAHPPHLEILSIQGPPTDRPPIHLEEPIPFRIEYRNQGDAPSDELVLSAVERSSGEVLSVNLPSLPAREIGEVTASLTSARADFQWDIRLLPTPTAITSRTRWSPQKLDSHLSRSWDLGKELADGEWSIEFDTLSSQGPISQRLFEPMNLGFETSKEARKKELFAGDLDVLDPSQARSVVDPFYAASLFNTGWWVGASEIHAPQNWQAPSFRLRIPLNEGPILARLAPLYRKVGPDMPNFTLDGDGVSFRITPENSSFEGIHPEKAVVEMTPPGLPISLEKVPGRSTGFGGFELTPLPVAFTPVLELPDSGPWRASAGMEIPKALHGRNAQSEFRVLADGKDWTPWLPLEPDTPIDSNRIQLRAWVDPTQTPHETYVRSIGFSLRRSTR